jgi:predicted double-glycine peptidase
MKSGTGPVWSQLLLAVDTVRNARLVTRRALSKSKGAYALKLLLKMTGGTRTRNGLVMSWVRVCEQGMIYYGFIEIVLLACLYRFENVEVCGETGEE